MKTFTKEQIRKKYKNKYIDFSRTYDYSEGKYIYEIRKVYDKIQENTTRGEDIETAFEFTR